MQGSYSTIYDPLFRVYAAEFFWQVLPWEWFKAQAIAESSLDPQARSSAGAIGLMQLMPDTAADLARHLGVTNSPRTPHVNIRMGIAYDRNCWDFWTSRRSREERLRFMFGSYNAGPGNILKAQGLARDRLLDNDRWQSIVACLPEITGKHAIETINYVARIERLYAELTAKE